MDRAIQQFEVNIQSASQLGIIYAAFEHKVTAVIKLEELLALNSFSLSAQLIAIFTTSFGLE